LRRDDFVMETMLATKEPVERAKEVASTFGNLTWGR
jgi:hypothetical protein